MHNLLGVEPPDWNRVSLKAEPAKVPTVVEESKALDCGLENSLKSEPGGDRIDMQFENFTSSVRKVYWLDFNGSRTLYQSLAPGGRYGTQTFDGHPWVVTDGQERCVGIYFATPPAAHVGIRK